MPYPARQLHHDFIRARVHVQYRRPCSLQSGSAVHISGLDACNAHVQLERRAADLTELAAMRDAEAWALQEQLSRARADHDAELDAAQQRLRSAETELESAREQAYEVKVRAARPWRDVSSGRRRRPLSTARPATTVSPRPDT